MPHMPDSETDRNHLSSEDRLLSSAAGKPFAEIGDLLKFTHSRALLIGVFSISFICFALLLNSSWNATPDSALYLSLGESLERGNGYVFNGEPHTFVPPGYPLLIAASAKLLGSSFFSYRVVMIVLGFLTAIAGYLFVRVLCGKDTALLVGGVFALNHVLLHFSAHTLSDVPFALVVTAAMIAVVKACDDRLRKPWIVLAGLLMGLPPLLRINGLGTAPAVVLGFWFMWGDFSRRERLLWIVIFLVLALVPFGYWQWLKASFPVSESEGTYWNAVAGRTLQDQLACILKSGWGHFRETSLALTGVYIRTGFLELIVPGITLYGMYAAVRNGDRLWVPLVAIQYAGISLSSAGARYILFMIPLLYLFFALGLVRITTCVPAIARRVPDPGRVLIVVFLIFGILNLGHNMVPIYHARTALESNGPETARSRPYFEAARWLSRHAPDATVLTSRPRIVHYLSGNRTIPLVRSGVPDHEIWVRGESQIERIVRTQNPEFLYIDSKGERMYWDVLGTLKAMNRRLERIDLPGSDRYRLFRIPGGSSR
jgi:4-amino-4-deoxy-L-arabinose transferase-like glycosyltransferase